MAYLDHLLGNARNIGTTVRSLLPNFSNTATKTTYVLKKEGFETFRTTKIVEARRLVKQEGYECTPPCE